MNVAHQCLTDPRPDAALALGERLTGRQWAGNGGRHIGRRGYAPCSGERGIVYLLRIGAGGRLHMLYLCSIAHPIRGNCSAETGRALTRGRGMVLENSSVASMSASVSLFRASVEPGEILLTAAARMAQPSHDAAAGVSSPTLGGDG